MAEKVYHYPLWIRIWHMFNAILCLVLIISGISMQFSEPERTLLIRFDLAVTTHNSAAVLLIVNYLFFLITNRLSGNRKHYKINEKGYGKMLITQFRYYSIGIFRGEKAPFPVSRERKFNPLQQFAYIVILYGFFPLLIITGLGLFFPEMIVTRIFGLSGLFLTDLFHILAGFIISIFMIVHIYFCTMGTRLTSLFRGMINGWVEIH
jgi:thiosulfate reductase cytochrome b subunit